jgi:alpha-glucoside transport system permease protein
VSTLEKFGQMFLAIGIFVAVVALVLLVVGRFGGRRGDKIVALGFILPTAIMLLVGLVYPAVNTIYQSFKDANGASFVGLDNFTQILTSSDERTVLRNTALWVLLTPFVATFIGLLYAVLIDRARVEAFAKALIFLPMAISFVGASVIWKFVYEYRPSGAGVTSHQIGLLNQVLVWMGFKSYQFLLNDPWNNVFLIIVMIWIQAGFAMTVLSAAIKAIPDDIVEAARLDGLGGIGMFRYITVPSIRPTLVVVLTTIAIGTLKTFDIVRTMTGAAFNTNIIANEFYSQSFRAGNQGLGAALAVFLFILVIPIVAYNIRQMRLARAR